MRGGLCCPASLVGGGRSYPVSFAGVEHYSPASLDLFLVLESILFPRVSRDKERRVDRFRVPYSLLRLGTYKNISQSTFAVVFNSLKMYPSAHYLRP